MPSTIDPALIHRTIDNSFVYGIHVALGVSAAALLCGAVLSAVFVGRGAVAQEETVAGVAGRSKPSRSPLAGAAREGEAA